VKKPDELPGSSCRDSGKADTEVLDENTENPNTPNESKSFTTVRYHSGFGKGRTPKTVVALGVRGCGGEI